MTKTYLIIGAHGGTGEALARALSGPDTRLILTARDAGNLPSMEGAEAYSLDTTNPESVSASLAALNLSQGLDGFAYCAGSIDLKPFGKTTDTDFAACFDLNVLGAVRILRGIEAALKQASGSVVLFSTVAVQTGFANHSIIASAKGALEGITRSLAAEWAPQVRVNALAPSLTDTGIAKPLTSSEKMAEGIAKTHPLQRLGTADDLANAAAFLLSDQSSWVTGQILGVDGGRSSIAGKG